MTDLKEYNMTKYQKNFIKQVICRIDFLEFFQTDEIFDPSIVKEIMSHYTRKEKDQVIKFNTINIGDMGHATPPSVSGQSMEGIQQTYTTNDGANKIIISNKALIVEINNYNTFEHMLESFKRVIPAMFNLKSFTSIRTAIRYINMYDANTIKVQKNFFTQTIACSLTPPVVNTDPSVQMTRSMNLTEYNIGEMTLNFRFGLYNKLYPNVIKTNDFVLDYDCYSTEALRSSGDVLHRISAGHDHIQRLFEGSITESLRTVMNDG